MIINSHGIEQIFQQSKRNHFENKMVSFLITEFTIFVVLLLVKRSLFEQDIFTF
ncbi:hypothetical protein [Psychrobacillus glaciei]|uniref:hypothetical protein n=1 Tax=Psychrobacillus glaciei TaxID=2283160 RepID=UPI00178C3B04|nr:hypothetical protein [Psychrobacillus glaciei]